MLQAWPTVCESFNFPQEEAAMEEVMEVIRAIRNRRAELNVPPSKKAHLTVAAEHKEVFEQGRGFLLRLGYASELCVVGADEAPKAEGMVTAITSTARAFLPLAELVDLEKEKARIEKELGKNKTELQKIETKLQNPGFVNKAPEHVVASERERAEKLKALIQKLEEQLSHL